jgi:putative transposase
VLIGLPVGYTPQDFPAKCTVYEYFTQWRDDGALRNINDLIVGAIRRLEAPSEEVEPSAASIDNQTVKTRKRSCSHSYDGGKKITGRKRNIAVDVLGLVLAMTVTVASLDDAHAARDMMKQLTKSKQPRLEVIWADSKYHNHAMYDWIEKQKNIDWRLEIVRRPQGVKGFVLLPKRWILERTFS